jgi:glucoamylase
MVGKLAPGWPGIEPRWTSSSKTGVGTALSPSSRVWFTLSHGILNEIYYPRLDLACTRDLGLLVADGEGFISEEKRDTESKVELMEGVPAYRLTNTSRSGRYRIEKEVITHPGREALLQLIRFVPLQGSPERYHLYVLLAPHLGNQGSGNTAWVGDYKGVPMLFAERGQLAFALACNSGWLKRSAGFVGCSDGWQDLASHGQMCWEYERAENGNVALMGEIDWVRSPQFLLALGFGVNWAEAGQRARSCLEEGFESPKREYVQRWRSWLEKARPSELADGELYRPSMAVLLAHEAQSLRGGMIASLSIPWGFNKGDNDLGGYHLVWPRDLVETAGALLACGCLKDARRVVHYLQSTQESDGHWGQNMWLDGTPYWSGQQLDETALPILLVDLAYRSGALDRNQLDGLWPMVYHAARFLVLNGPVSAQDRWEEDPGYSPFTLATEIAALLAAADLAELQQESGLASYLRQIADFWNASVEDWTYATGTELAKRFGVEGYYVRIAPPQPSEAASPLFGFVAIKNRPPGDSLLPADDIVSPDALALVRFGLRAPDDPRILNTIKVIDGLLKLETPTGPAWYRYDDDGYGEHEDGSPFDGTGQGRAWPLLTGERGHFELAAGHRDAALRLLKTMASFANPGGLIPEQIWDAADIPEKELFFGRPSGSAMPLVWAHAEYIKLCRAIADGAVFDTPPQTLARYSRTSPKPAFAIWRFNQKISAAAAGRSLRIETLEPSRIHWSADGWTQVHDTETRESGFGLHTADLPTEALKPGAEVLFTFFWPSARRWEGRDFSVLIAPDKNV